jgi:hypothetical protein
MTYPLTRRRTCDLRRGDVIRNYGHRETVVRVAPVAGSPVMRVDVEPDAHYFCTRSSTHEVES